MIGVFAPELYPDHSKDISQRTGRKPCDPQDFFYTIAISKHFDDFDFLCGSNCCRRRFVYFVTHGIKNTGIFLFTKIIIAYF